MWTLDSCSPWWRNDCWSIIWLIFFLLCARWMWHKGCWHSLPGWVLPFYSNISVKPATDTHRDAQPWWNLMHFTVKNEHQSSKWKVVWCTAHRHKERKSEISLLLLFSYFSKWNIEKNIISWVWCHILDWPLWLCCMSDWSNNPPSLATVIEYKIIITLSDKYLI